MRYQIALLGLALLIPRLTQAASDEPLYTQKGSDLSIAEILKEGKLPTGHNSTAGATGSIVQVNKRLVEVGPDADKPIPKDIEIHTLANSAIPRKDFAKWSRWYQEDGHTQVFRLFKDEANVRNTRPLAARVEAFGMLSWHHGDWHEWSGTYTIVKSEAASIFQVMNSKSEWAVHLDMDGNGNVIYNPRQDPKDRKIIAKEMTGKPFFIRVRDNGLDYEVYLNKEKVGSGSYPRPEGHSSFRWGMYKGEHEVKHDAMIFVTGVVFK